MGPLCSNAERIFCLNRMGFKYMDPGPVSNEINKL